MFARCPVDVECPNEPRVFATCKVVSINSFNETAHVKFDDPFDYRQFFEMVPNEVKEIPLSVLEHCHIFKGSRVVADERIATVVEFSELNNGMYEYYLQDNESREFFSAKESTISAPFISGDANPVNQLKNYELQNPCWYFGRQIVKKTTNILDNSIYGFSELAGCRIYLKAFQLNTIMMCLQSNPCRYMIADEVGLGKTIEASSVLKIYLNDKSQQKVIIAVPEALLAQWKAELLFKFDLLEGMNPHNNEIVFTSVEKLGSKEANFSWDFVIIDEVHNYLGNYDSYDTIHRMSKNANNILLLSATPIQQREEEYLKLLRLISPNYYDEMQLNQFSEIVAKQNRISITIHSLLDDIDSLENEVLPGVKGDPHHDEDVIDEIDEIMDSLNELSETVSDLRLTEMIKAIDMSSQEFDLHEIKVAISYVCDNYQLSSKIIRGRRAMLGVYPKNENAQFSERKLVELTYETNQEINYYECEAYRVLEEWITGEQDNLDSDKVKYEIKPLIESFFSSPWAYVSQLEKSKMPMPQEVISCAHRWEEDENIAVENLADVMDEPENHPSRLIKLISYIDTELFGKKVVVFTDFDQTFTYYYKIFAKAFGEVEVAGFSKIIDSEQAEINIYRFQSDSDCHILICDRFGGEGRNLQAADYIVHVDLPWNINTIEQRIGRLDRMGRDVTVPVTSIVIHTLNTYEHQLFKYWNEGLNVFRTSLSGLEIIMNDINMKITESILTDFEFGLYRLIPALVDEATKMREMVQQEQIYDSIALRYRPLYVQLEKLLTYYQFNENTLFTDTMMSWASLSGFGSVKDNDKSLVDFNENHFSIKSAQNSFLIPPNWEDFLAKKQNEIAIKVQRGYEDDGEFVKLNKDRTIKGTFDRGYAIKHDYIHFYAPGDDVFDCIVDNALHSYRGMCTGFAAESSIDWQGFYYSFSISPNERILIDNGVSLHMLGPFRQYLATSLINVPVGFAKYDNIPDSKVVEELNRLTKIGYFHADKTIEHLGRRSRDGGFLQIGRKYKMNYIDWFKLGHDDDIWKNDVVKSSEIAEKIAIENFKNKSDLHGARSMIEQLLLSKESRERYYCNSEEESIEKLRSQYEVVYNSLEKPIIRLEAAAFVWLIEI